MKIKAVIFDFDGTIFDSWPQTFQIYKKVIKEFDGPFKNLGEDTLELLVRNLWGTPGREVFRILFRKKSLMPFVLKSWQKYEKTVEPKPKIIERFYPTLEWLKKNNILACLATNRGSISLARCLPYLNADPNQTFDLIQTHKPKGLKPITFFFEKFFKKRVHKNLLATGYAKPHPEALSPIIKRLNDIYGIQKEEILHVGDTIFDHQAAKAAKINSKVVLTGAINTKERWFSWCDDIPEESIMNSVADLPESIKNLEKNVES